MTRILSVQFRGTINIIGVGSFSMISPDPKIGLSLEAHKLGIRIKVPHHQFIAPFEHICLIEDEEVEDKA
jgi:hypothetical protein